jgi:selenocysteine lyase/cysteine desulfurase
MPDAEKVRAVREALPATGAGIYLATPLAGPLPAESHAAMAEIAEWELRTGRGHRDRADDVAARLDEARAAVAAILATDLERVALAHGIEDAFARAIRRVDWRPGDRIALVDDPGTAPLRTVAPRDVTVVDFDPAGGEIPGGARLVVAPLVRATTGERLPIARLAAVAHSRGAIVLVEASLALGATAVDLESLDADFLVARSEAWLLGPEGLAVVVGEGVEGAAAAGSGVHLPSLVGLARGAGWLSMYVGLPWVLERGQRLTGHLAERLAAIDGVRLLTPDDRATTLVFSIARWSADAALDELGRRVFLLASAAPGVDAVRVGIGFWNTEDELDRLADAVRLLAAHTPESLPRRPQLAMLGDG